LSLTTKLEVLWLYIRGDSEVVVNQVMGESSCHDSLMAAYWQEVRKLEKKFNGFKLHHILWRDNEPADALGQHGSSHEPPPPVVFA
jgi:hypothetical protein